MNIVRAARHARLRLIIPALALAVTTSALIIPLSQTASAQATTRAVTSGGPKPTIVLEHGAWANTASWDAVIQRLQADGYIVDAPPNPLQGLPYDSSYLADFLHSISGPIILVGHSYGGAVITNAATGDSQVKALVYVDAFAPAQGQTLAQLLTAYPGSCVVPANLTVVTLPPYSPELNPVERLWLYLRQHHWSNRAYEDLDALEEAAVSGWRAVCLHPEKVKTLCRCKYLPPGS